MLTLFDLPPELDLDLLSDAFVNFAETQFETAQIPSSVEIFSWTEVAADAFEKTCNQRLHTADHAFLQAVWTKGRLAVIALSGGLTQTQQIALYHDLIASHEDVTPQVTGWRIVSQNPSSIPRADRHAPVLATPCQQTYLHLQALQDNGQHPAIAISPIILSHPHVPALEATFEVLQERHEILHMSFAQTPEHTYLRLHDDQPPAFTTKRYFRRSIAFAQLVERTEAALSKRLSRTGPLWAACLVRRGSEAALVCVMSETIADPHTAALIRADIVKFYEWFKTNPNADPPEKPAKRQFLDVADAPRDLQPALSWWGKLPIRPLTHDTQTANACAPVVTWTEDVPLSRDSRFGGDLQPLFFHMFLNCIRATGDTTFAWALVRAYDLRPAHAADMLGQFSMDVPIWLGDLSADGEPHDTARRHAATLKHGIISPKDLARAYPNKIPQRIPYLFDWRPQRPGADTLALPQDVTLRVWHDDKVLRTQWAVRCDHPLSQKERILRKLFEQMIADNFMT